MHHIYTKAKLLLHIYFKYFRVEMKPTDKVIKQFQPAYPEKNFFSHIILINLCLMRSYPTIKLLSSTVHSCSAHLPTPTYVNTMFRRMQCGLWQAPYCQLPVAEWPLQKNCCKDMVNEHFFQKCHCSLNN